jgi:hypothetical protein
MMYVVVLTPFFKIEFYSLSAPPVSSVCAQPQSKSVVAVYSTAVCLRNETSW